MFDDYVEFVEQLLEGTGWEVYDAEMAPDFILLAPCGNTVEVDGTCCFPERHVSPLRELGYV